MTILEIFGFFCAFFIGLIMGVMGGGGSILAVPVMAYIYHLDEKTSTAYSLFIVGITGLIGSIQHARKGLVSGLPILAFGIPAVMGVTVTRAFIVPRLPDVLFHIGDFDVTRRMGMLGFFAILMFLASASMLKNLSIKDDLNQKAVFHPMMISEGLFIGGLTGLVGAGGGFLIVPALMMIAKLNFKKAVGTSLFIIAVNSLSGFFLGDVFHMKINWTFLLIFLTLSLIGMAAGFYISQFIETRKLKKLFAYFVIVMACFIFILEFLVR